MKTKLTVEHPLLTIKQLLELAEAGRLERSTHCGNVALRDLAIITNLPAEVIVGDTIHGNDRHARPAQIKVGNDSFRLAPLKVADGQVVGRLPVPAEKMQAAATKYPSLKTLAGPHESAGTLHFESLLKLKLPGGRPRLLTELLAATGDVGRALMEQLATQGIVRRSVSETGRIIDRAPWRRNIALRRIWC